MAKKEFKVTSIKDDVITISGNGEFSFLEEIIFNNTTSGIVLKANKESAHVVLLKKDDLNQVEINDKAISYENIFKANIFNDQFGTVIDIFGDTIFENEFFVESKKTREKIGEKEIFSEAKPIYAREQVNQPLFSGTLVIDGVLPIGKGQKELIIGDRATGKTSIAVTAMIAQKKEDVKNIYLAIGKKREEIIQIRNVLKEHEVLEKTIIISIAADDTTASKYLAPYLASSIAEYYQEQNQNILLIVDDLTNHADAYRELSLLLGTAPGREAYPGDIFYAHSRFLEKAGRYSKEFGGGSITILPIVQTLAGDISGYIPTNIISITDGQIYTSTNVFNEGRRPAIEITYSVSRLGSQVQKRSLARATSQMKRIISEYENIKKLSSFNSIESKENEKIMEMGKTFEVLIDQKLYEVVDYNTAIILFELLKGGMLSFYNSGEKYEEEISFIRDILKVFLTKDIIGIKMCELFNRREISDEVIQLYLKQIILPLLKYHILSENKWLRNDPKFIKTFKDIRNDGRVLLSYERRGFEKGIAYEI